MGQPEIGRDTATWAGARKSQTGRIEVTESGNLGLGQHSVLLKREKRTRSFGCRLTGQSQAPYQVSYYQRQIIVKTPRCAADTATCLRARAKPEDPSTI